jgi:hypothetical protein
MAIPIVPNLQNFSFIIPAGQVLKLAADRHRTYLSVGLAIDKIADVLHMWVGIDPPADVTDWMVLGSSTQTSIRLEYGVYGPVWLTQSGVGEGHTILLSNLAEDDTATLVARQPDPVTLG